MAPEKETAAAGAAGGGRALGLNFRDAGAGGGLAEGRLFRSGCPAGTSAGDWETVVRRHGIRTIVDLRCPGERRDDPAAPAGVATVPLPFLETIEDRWVNPRFTDPRSTAGRYLEMIEASGTAVPGIFGLLAEPGRLPVLVHCAAGRDRTGMVCALVLGAVGVPVGRIAADYALSHHQVGDGHGASPDTIEELFVLIEGKYGGLTALLETLGVTGDLRRAVMERCR